MIFLGSDHAGFTLKSHLLPWLARQQYEVCDMGADTLVSEDDYPDMVRPVAEKIAQRPDVDRGIIIGGSGQGEAIVANRLPGVRCTVFYGPRMPHTAVNQEGDWSDDPYAAVRLMRQHNDANILALGARFITLEEAQEAVTLFLTTPFEGGRHARRVEKIEREAK